MEFKSYKTYIDKLIADNFDFATFSPENSGELFNIFKNNFYRDTPYWKEKTVDGDIFYIELKKYGENRKRVFLKFSFISNAKKPRDLGLTLTDEEFKPLNETVEISFSDVWKDHSILTSNLKIYVEKGLNLANQIN